MRYIPLRKTVYDDICARYDLGRYCGDPDKIFGSESFPDGLPDIFEEEEVILFTPGRQQGGRVRSLTARILHVDPITIKVTGMGT